MTFFTADLHFGHASIIRYCRRPFASVDEMNAALVSNWNGAVRAADEVYIVGDMFFRCENVESILSKLKGRKHLVLGNHDSSWIGDLDLSAYFASVDRIAQFSDGENLFWGDCHSWNSVV